jgi:hypothetical protein
MLMRRNLKCFNAKPSPQPMSRKVLCLSFLKYVLIKYSNEFNRKEKCGFEYHKWSDFRCSEDIYKNAWENLKLNRNTKFTKNMIDFFSNYNITITYSTGNLAHDGDIIEENISLLELFKDLKFQDLTIDLAKVINSFNLFS